MTQFGAERRRLLNFLGQVSLLSVVVPIDGGASRLPQAEPKTRPLSHQEFLASMRDVARLTVKERFLDNFKHLMRQTAQGCVVDNNRWVYPSAAYADYLFSRDSFWGAATLQDHDLSQMIVDQFRSDQQHNPNGQIATALRRDGARPENRDRPEESTMMYILHNYLLTRMGVQPDKSSLQSAFAYIRSNVQNGHYVTTGETRSGPGFDGINQIGTYHYWADTYRPAGQPAATPEVFAYNQGLLCVTLRCLREMGIAVDDQLYQNSIAVYANLVNPADGVSLPQRKGASVMDPSALVGEALSLYYFSAPLLSDKRVGATLGHLARTWYPDGNFLGFKVISDYHGNYRPATEYSGGPVNAPGDYQRGASWLLYDALALYAGARHGVNDAQTLLSQRLSSETRGGWTSHEFIKTGPTNLGTSDPQRNGYGWNSFVANLLP